MFDLDTFIHIVGHVLEVVYVEDFLDLWYLERGKGQQKDQEEYEALAQSHGDTMQRTPTT